MNYSQKISERLWNISDKGELESKREQTFIDDIVQKNHIERTILENIEGINTVFDAGAGSGRFSILLAKKGIKVTHFDISDSMINKAKELADKENVLDNITFIRGALEDLSSYKDKEFDLVMSFDSPISYTYPNQESVIKELIRIGKKKIIISVTSRLGSLPYLSNPVQKYQFILDNNCDDTWVKWLLDSHDKLVGNFIFNKELCDEMLERGIIGNGEYEIKEYEKGKAPWCITYGFMPDELENLLKNYGVKNIRLAGPGAFARTVPKEILKKIMLDEKQKRDFLEFSYKFDKNKYVCGLGKDNLLVYGELE